MQPIQPIGSNVRSYQAISPIKPQSYPSNNTDSQIGSASFPKENLTEIAIRRHEDRIQKSTAREIEELDRFKRTGVMSSEAAEALKNYALAAMQIDLGQVQK